MNERTQFSHRVATASILIWASTTQVGCARVGFKQPVVSDVVLARRTSVGPGADYKGLLEQEEAHLALVVQRTCSAREIRTVRRTVTRERVIENPQIDISAAVLGALLVGGGLYATLDAKHLAAKSAASSSSETGSDSGTSASTYRGIGIGTIAAGGLAFVVPIVDLMRARGAQQDVTHVTVDGGILHERVSCSGPPPVAAHVRVIGRALGPNPVEAPLGETDRDGRVDVDLATVLPAEIWQDGRNGQKLSLLVDNKDVGSADLVPVRSAQDERAFRASGLTVCREEPTVTHCSGARSYLTSFPAGAHVVEVSAVLAEAQSKLDALRREAREAEELARREAELAAQREASRARAAQDAVRAAQQQKAACSAKCAASCKSTASPSACARSCVASNCK